MSGRRVEAARNDGLILGAAREVFAADPKAPIDAIHTPAESRLPGPPPRWEEIDQRWTT